VAGKDTSRGRATGTTGAREVRLFSGGFEVPAGVMEVTANRAGGPDSRNRSPLRATESVNRKKDQGTTGIMSRLIKGTKNEKLTEQEKKKFSGNKKKNPVKSGNGKPQWSVKPKN